MKINFNSFFNCLCFCILCTSCSSDTTTSTTTLTFSSFTRRTVSSAKFCLKRLRFKQDDVDTDSGTDNIDFSPGLVTLSSSGTTIGNAVLPIGTYKRVELDIEEDCDATTQKGIEFTNDNGSFDSDSTTTIKFRGTFEANEANETLSLGISNIITALDAITGSPADNDIRDALEASGADGDFQ